MIFNKNNKEDIIIVDNFLDTSEFERLKSFILPVQSNLSAFPLYFNTKVNTMGLDSDWSCYYTHLIYQDYQIQSAAFFNIIQEIFLPKMINGYNFKM